MSNIRSARYIFFFIISSLLGTDQPTSPNLNIYFNVENKPSAIASNVSNLSQNLKNNIDIRTMAALLNDASLKAQQWLNVLSDHPLTCLFMCSLSGYCLSIYRITTLANTIRHHRWSIWNNKQTAQQLLDNSFESLSHELLVDIQKQYQTPETLTNFLLPLMQFMRDVDTEFEHLETYVRWYTRAQTVKVQRLLLFDNLLLEEIPLRMQRLAYIKEIFLRWVAEYTLAANAQVGHA